MKKHLFIKLSLLLLLVIWNTHAWAVTYNPSGVAQQTMQSQQVMQTGGAYNGTVYEPFSNATPSEASNPSKAPSGPRREQSSRNPGEVDPDAASNQSPIGEPWVMVLFAMAFAGVVAIRAHKKKMVKQETQNNDIMKTSGKYLAITLLMLTLGVGQIGAHDWTNSLWTVWDSGDRNWSSAYFYIWNGSGNSGRKAMTRLGSSGQFYHGGFTWNGYTGVQFSNVSSGEGEYTTDINDYANGRLFVSMDSWSNGKLNWQCIEDPKKGSSGYSIYFDDSNTNWGGGNMYFKYGVDWSTDGYNRNIAFNATKVYGTANLYKLTASQSDTKTAGATNASGQLSHDIYYSTWYISKEVGWTGGNTIYDDAHLTARTAYQTSAISGDVTVIPTAKASGNGENSNPDIWTTTVYSGYTRNVSIASLTGGTITVSYKDVNNTDQSFNSGTTAVAHTCIIAVTVSANDGYTYDEGSLTVGGEDLESGGTYIVRGDIEISATFTEHKSTITINTPESYEGTLSVTGNKSLGVATNQSVTATAAAGFRFDHWEKTGHAVLSSTTDNPVTISTDGADGETGTVTAVFAPRYTLVGSVWGTDVDGSGMPGWSDYSKTFDYVSANTFRRTLTLEGNKKYKFRIHDILNPDYNLGGGSEYNVELNEKHTTFNQTGGDVTFSIGGSDEITFEIDGFENGYPQAHVLGTKPSYSISFDSKTLFADGTTGSTTGGTVKAVDGYDFDLAVVGKVKAGGTAVFTAKPEDGYTFAGWYSNEECTSAYVAGSGVTFSGENNTVMTLSGIDADKTVYAKFTEVRTEVYLISRGSGHIEVETAPDVWTHQKNLNPANTIYVGKHTTYNIRAVNESGNYFSEWRKSGFTDDFQIDDDNEEDYSESNTEGVLKGKGIGAGNQILYAQFLELDKVYFRNWNADANEGAGAPLWENVYVYFNITYSGDCAVSSSDANHKKLMERKGSSDVYWAYIPRDIAKNYSDNNADNDKIAFSNSDFSTSYRFYNGEAADWGHYNSHLDMFVPTHSDVKTSGTGLNGTTYYKGYWKKSYGYVGFLGGYTLKQYGSSSYSYAMPNYNFKIVDENTIQTTFYIKNATKTYDFMIESDGEVRYITSPTVGDVGKAVKANSCSNVTMTEYNSGYPHFTLHPNKEGLYTFTIDQSGDRMKISIDYPEAVGDYRIKHTYSSGTKTTYSNAVKAAKVAESDTVSLFLSNVGTPVTVLQKCTLINESTKLPVWADLNNTNLGGFNSKEPGVYKIGITVTNDAVSNTPIVEAYTGNYYIHVNAKTKNYLTTDGYPRSGNSVGTKFTKFVKNSKLGDTYDYYWVDWFQKVNDSEESSYERISEAQSVVATIGNDYNIDLAGELGDDEYSDEGKTTTDGANVRYGYDSKSNTFTRAMITGAGSSIKIINNVRAGDVKILRKDGDPATDADWEDAYNTERSAQDADNWIYTFNAKVREGSTATTTSSYNEQSMTLADGQKLLGGTGSKVYTVDVMYDFKTNRLISAWVPEPATQYKEPISLESNLMVVRQEDGSPTLLNLVVDPEDDSNEGGLLKVKQVYTVMEFTKANWANSAWTTTGGGYKDAYFWISLPYDCYVSDIFGIPNYGSEDGSYWVLQTYRGDLRAEKGWWAETESWWYDMDRDDIMKANQGYVIRLTNLDDYGKPFYSTSDISKLRLYFPSANPDELTVGILKSDTVINYPEIKCDIWRGKETNTNEGNPDWDRRAIDSNWRIIGSPSFNSAHIKTPGWDETYPTSPNVKGDLQFCYKWSLLAGIPQYTIQDANAADFEFKATHAYFVQYAGDITWEKYPTAPFVGFRAQKQNQDEVTDQTLRLVLNKDGEQADVTYIKRMEEGATEGYDLNKDLSKVMNGRMANLYTIAGYYKMGGNCLPDTTSIVPVGVRTAVAGDYTFSMPEGTNGTGVYLIDNVAGTRTNLALGDYTVTLAKGTFDDRFSLELSPIAQTPTDIEQTGADVMDGVRKVMVDGILYIVKDGRIYDATGTRVQ